jgi:tRNA pseudouridine38-40 synthase
VAVFDMEWNHSGPELQRALNAGLPTDIAIRALKKTSADFHPRYGALRRCYRYRLLASEWPDPLAERYALRVWPAPDEEAMAAAASSLVGPA